MLQNDIRLAPGARIFNAEIETGTTLPDSPLVGRIFFLTTTVGNFEKGLYVYDGTAWQTGDISSITAGTGLAGGGSGGDITLSLSTATQNTLAASASTTYVNAKTWPFSVITSTPTTLAGYGITDAYTKTTIDSSLALKANLASPTFTGVVTVPTPVNSTDATTKTYVDTADALKAPLASPTFTGTVTVPTPATTTAATTKTYVDTALALKANLASPTFTGTVTVPTPATTTAATTKTYVDTADALKANLASPTFTGVVTVPTPVNATDASTKAYVDAKTWAWSTITSAPTTIAGYGITDAYTKTTIDSSLALKANLASPTFTGTVTVPTPVNTTDAVTKAYVDTPVIQTVAYASTLSIAVNGNSDIVRISLTGNVTSLVFTGGVDGQKIIIELLQDAAGSRTVAFGSSFRFGTDLTAITLTTTANKLDRVGVIYNATAAKFDVVSMVRGF